MFGLNKKLRQKEAAAAADKKKKQGDKQHQAASKSLAVIPDLICKV